MSPPTRGTRLGVGSETGSESLVGDLDLTRSVRPAADTIVTPRGPWQVFATVHYVVGKRGRLRALLIVRCVYCRQDHQHTAAADFVSGRRTASCAGGRYVVHVGRESVGEAVA